MNLKRISGLVWVLFTFLPLGHSENIDFIEDDLKKALGVAGREGKLVFIDFWASYCAPCKMMEEYVFTAPNVADKMRKGYIAVKINIQSFDGYDLKTQFNVRMLPTLIILDSKGKPVARYEESMTASRLEGILALHDKAQHRTRVGNATSVLAHSSSTQYNNAPARAQTTSVATASVPKKNATIAPPSAKKSTAALPPNTQKSAIPTTGFALQVAAFTDYTAASDKYFSMQQALASSVQKPKILRKRREDGSFLYRIIVGNFPTKQNADSFRKSQSLEYAVIKSYEELKK
jgi:thioredoxin-like negative regulator of GroEL